MTQPMIEALLQIVVAERAEANANLNVYLQNPVGVGEHPNIIQEMNKLIGKVADANGKIEVLEKMISQINEQIANETKA